MYKDTTTSSKCVFRQCKDTEYALKNLFRGLEFCLPISIEVAQKFAIIFDVSPNIFIKKEVKHG